MKSFVSLALTLVLITAMLVGCGCTNRNIDNTSAPTVLPTNEELWNTTESTTRATTESTTVPTTTDATSDSAGSANGNTGSDTADHNATNENGGMDTATDSTNATEGPLERSARRMMPGSR